VVAVTELEPILDSVYRQLVKLKLPVADWLQPGLTEKEIKVKARDFPYALPLELIQLYQWRNGLRPEQDSDHELFPGGYFLSLEEALHDYGELRRVAEQIGREAGLDSAKIWDPHWFPIFRNIGGDYFIVPCTKKKKEAAPVYFVVKDDRDLTQLYASLSEMMLTVIRRYESGAYFVDGRGLIQEDPVKIARLELHADAVGGGPTDATQMDDQVQRLLRSLRQETGAAQAKAVKELMRLKTTRLTQPLLELLHHDSPTVRMLTARILGERRDATAVSALITVLADWDSRVRGAGAEALGNLRDSSALDALMRSLDDTDPMVQAKAAWALGELRDRRVVDRLIQALQDGGSAAVRMAAARTLGERREVKAVPVLLQALQDRFTDIRQLAAWALGEIGEHSATEALTQLVQDDGNEIVRRLAREALEKIQKPG
jgi:hypothetical protein